METLKSFRNFHRDYSLNGYTIASEWNYSQHRPYKKDILKDKKRLYIHLFYNTEQRAEDERNLNDLLSELYHELNTNTRIEKNEKLYTKYFVFKESKKGMQIKEKHDVIDKQKRYYGYFALISNEKMTSWEPHCHNHFNNTVKC